MNNKRTHGGSTGDTPGKSNKKNPKKTVKKSLFVKKPQEAKSSLSTPASWLDAETAALIQYIALYWDGPVKDGWPTNKAPYFWDCCAKAISETTGQPRKTGEYLN